MIKRFENPHLYTDEGLRTSEKLLLHCCCGPCATAVVERVLPFVRPTLYYYNPNTQPLSEYEKRGEEVKKVAEFFGLDYIVEDYDCNEFLHTVAGFEDEKEGGRRCPLCFSLRLRKSAQYAKEHEYDAFCTTLTVSPHKNAKLINEIGERVESEYGVKWIYSDFKKADGYKRSIVLSKELALYRQDYCGCQFSKEGK